MPGQLQELLAMNRAEELGYDVWREFVIPPFYQELSVEHTRKPKIIIGGRGCGKTMLLRYLSHETTFSLNRSEIPRSAISHVGIYWRADTQFATLMQHRDVKEDTWAAAFRHLVALVLGIEVLRSLKSISTSAIGLFGSERLAQLNFRRLQPFSSKLPFQYDELREFLEDSLAEFESWINDVRSIPQPHFLPGDNFVKKLILLIRDQINELSDAVYFVYVDEYENLETYQQRIVNTWLKHSEPPLIFNLAMKRNGFKTRATEGAEMLSDLHDFRDIDIEQFEGDDFLVFSAEILLLRLKLAEINVPQLNPEWIHDTARLSDRKDVAYVKNVQTAVKNLFSSPTHQELALEVFANAFLRQRLSDRVTKSLQMRQAKEQSLEAYMLPDFPEASIIIPALLSRETVSDAEVKEELVRLKKGETNKFTGATNWIHNNFVGCYLQLFDGLSRPCPLYSGFATFCSMSRGNLRHVLVLCFQALGRATKGVDKIQSVPSTLQAETARRVSTELLAEVRSFGKQGNNLYTFVLRLGSLFSLSQQQPSQSEPERNHFSIQGGTSELNESQQSFLSEAIKWSVLFEEKGTKKKVTADPESNEYVLNPIYAPYFHISFRKKRKLEFSVREIATLISGSYADVKTLLRNYQRRWSVDLSDASLPLFSHLDDEGPQ